MFRTTPGFTLESFMHIKAHTYQMLCYELQLLEMSMLSLELPINSRFSYLS